VPENELARVLDASGPFASIYMDTSGDVEDAAHRVAVRWKHLRGGPGYPAYPAARPRQNGMGTAALVLGVVALVLAVLILFGPLGALLGLLA